MGKEISNVWDDDNIAYVWMRFALEQAIGLICLHNLASVYRHSWTHGNEKMSEWAYWYCIVVALAMGMLGISWVGVAHASRALRSRIWQ